MRIIAGKWRGRLLAQPPQNITRPTTDRVREALFSMLLSRVGSFEGMYVLDVFAGSGALGLEALSRGAAHVTFAEKNLAVRRVLKQNIESFDCLDCVAVAHDALSITHTNRAFDLIFMDPPYGVGLEYELVPILIERGYINTSTLIVLETQSAAIPSDFSGLTCSNSRSYGNCALSIWQYFG